MESKSRAKRPREPLVTFPNCENTNEQLYQRHSFPELPEDLYTSDCQSGHFATTSKKLSRAAGHSLHEPALFGVSAHHSQPVVHHHAAIAAFRPEENTSASVQQGKQHPRHLQTAPAALDEFPSDVDVQCFVAALSARAEGLKCQQHACDVVALPFPGMHTLDLTFPLAQPALCEAAQMLLEHPRDFQAALMRCPLSQVLYLHRPKPFWCPTSVSFAWIRGLCPEVSLCLLVHHAVTQLQPGLSDPHVYAAFTLQVDAASILVQIDASSAVHHHLS